MKDQFDNPDSTAIYKAVSDYYEGWYAPDTRLVNHCLHPDLAKRAIRRDSEGKQSLGSSTKEQLLGYTIEGGGSKLPVGERHWDIKIRDMYEEIAAVTVLSTEYVEYIQLAKLDDQWKIVNVIWTLNRANPNSA